MLTSFVNHGYNRIQVDDVIRTGEKAADKFGVWLCTSLTWGVSCGEMMVKYDRRWTHIGGREGRFSSHISLPQL
jgi:hypothetical protein